MATGTRQDKAVECLKGVLARIFFSDGGYLIGRLDTGDSIVGDMLEPNLGQEYEFWGDWGNHPQYGRQFKFRRYVTVLPKSTDGIIRYLVRIAKWVKTARAKIIVDLYGEDTLQILKEDPERVAREVKGITLARAKDVQEFLKQNEALEAATVEIEGIIGKVRGLPKRLPTDLLKEFGSDAPTVVRNDPYVLTNFYGVGFKLADSVAMLNDYPPDGILRKKAAIKHVLAEAAKMNGHTCLTIRRALDDSQTLINCQTDEGMAKLAEEQEVFYLGSDYVALAHIHHDEKSIAGIARSILEKPLRESITVPSDDLAPDQIRAATLLCSQRMGLLLGPPGSGKTYLFARIVKGMRQAGLRNILFCAPTGKAATRMTESLQELIPGAQARTIHKTLGPQMDFDSGTFTFRHGAGNPLECDAICVDETSMLDTHLAARLLEACTPDMIVLFIGDPDQLPSIGPGSVLKDLSKAGVPTAELNEIKRNAGQIVRACHAIRLGRSIQWSPKVDLENGDNLRHINKRSGKDIIDAIVQIACTKVADFGFDPFWDFQVVAPMNERSEVSCKALNEALSEALNPGVNIRGFDFRVGDKIVRTRNEVVKGGYGTKIDPGFFEASADEMGAVEVVNGDVGKVIAIEKNSKKKWIIVARLGNPDRVVYLARDSHFLQRAYCMTTHKMQGSDAPIVAIPLHRSVGSFPDRSWIYTSISRAKYLCLTVGDQGVAQNMIRRLSTDRTTKLVERFQGKV